MTSDEIRELLLDLQSLALETEQAELVILRKAQERLDQLPETPSSEAERRLLRGVIHQAEVTLGLKSRTD
jgi:hypothetical protein